MIEALLLLLACQLSGEALVRAADIGIPGPVVGFALLFALLLWRGRRPGSATTEDRPLPGRLGEVADGLLANLALLFVPAAVGIIQHLARVREAALPITVALIVSTLLAMTVTALVFEGVRRWMARRRDAR